VPAMHRYTAWQMMTTMMVTALRLQQHAADDTHSWHSDVEISWHELYGYTSNSSLREDTDVSSMIALTTLKNVCQTGECNWKANAIKRTLRKRLHDAVEQLTTQNIHDYLQSKHAAYAQRILLRFTEAAFAVWLPHGEKSPTCANLH